MGKLYEPTLLRLKKIVDFVSLYGEVSTSTIRKTFDLDEAYTSRLLKRLIQEEILIRRTNDELRSYYYSIHPTKQNTEIIIPDIRKKAKPKILIPRTTLTKNEFKKKIFDYVKNNPQSSRKEIAIGIDRVDSYSGMLARYLRELVEDEILTIETAGYTKQDCDGIQRKDRKLYSVSTKALTDEFYDICKPKQSAKPGIQLEIYELLQTCKKPLTVWELVEHFEVSHHVIRRELDRLLDKDLIKQVREKKTLIKYFV